MYGYCCCHYIAVLLMMMMMMMMAIMMMMIMRMLITWMTIYDETLFLQSMTYSSNGPARSGG